MADISKVILPDESEYDIKDAVAREHGLYYGTCATAKGTAAKVAIVAGISELITGLSIAVKFTYENTIANPTLNVNSLGAIAIKRYGTTAPSTSAASSWNAGEVVTLTYDGTYWQMHNWLNTTYSGMTDAEYQAGTLTTNRLITPARLKAAVKLHAPVTSVNTRTGDVVLTSSDVGISSSDITAWNDAVTNANLALSGVNGSIIYDQTFTISSGVASFTPHVYLKGVEVTTNYATSCFVWKYRLIDGSEVTLATKSDRGCDVTISSMGYGGHVIGIFTPPE